MADPQSTRTLKGIRRHEAQRLPLTEKTWCYIYFARSGATVKIRWRVVS